ncbi:MAG: hypothetical protein GC164_07590 [Phycisphaera sp.]|nr:hypothetical protein [Phycisphaera sp.]
MTRIPTQSPQDGIDGPDDESDKSLSLMGGVMQSEGLPEADLDMQSTRGSSKLLSHGSMLVVLIFVVAAGSIYAMKVTQGAIRSDPQTKEVEARVEQALAKLSRPSAMAQDDPLLQQNLGSLFKDTDAIVSMFKSDMTAHQVPIEYVQKNPFELYNESPVADASADPGAGANNRVLQQLEMELGDLELQTVMLGARPVAVISGEIVQPGQSVGSFKVKTISQLAVVLEASGHDFTLSLKNDQTPNKPGGKRR